jgi:L-cysteine:1D-myo-inositol 2-amino-2-deoxy-alpha-D-glucopyranoside ligase
MPDHYLRASDEIAHIVELVEGLVSKGYAYERDGWVYFHVAADPGFGKLAAATGLVGYDALLSTANERGNNPNDPRKRDPLDFVLWQGQQPGEPAWPSPWGPGRPGWHIECSAMAMHYLGPRIDIHGGGADLIFPHHTCEIAQSENVTGERPFVGTWAHLAMVQQDGEKMSKSLGNLTRVSDLLPHEAPDAIRLLLLSYHYRTAWEYTPGAMRLAAERAARLETTLAAAEDADGDQPDERASRARADVIARLEDDLDTPGALTAIEELASVMRTRTVAGGPEVLREVADVLGLRLRPPTAHLSRCVEPAEAVPGADA